MECRAKIFLAYCNCILYHQPQFSDDITICGRSDFPCVKNIARQLRVQSNSTFSCDCMPGCFEFKYDADITMAPLLPQSRALNGLSDSDVSIVHVFYKTNNYHSQIKDEVFGFTEFLCKNDHFTHKNSLLGDFFFFI